MNKKIWLEHAQLSLIPVRPPGYLPISSINNNFIEGILWRHLAKIIIKVQTNLEITTAQLQTITSGKKTKQNRAFQRKQYFLM